MDSEAEIYTSSGKTYKSQNVIAVITFSCLCWKALLSCAVFDLVIWMKCCLFYNTVLQKLVLARIWFELAGLLSSSLTTEVILWCSDESLCSLLWSWWGEGCCGDRPSAQHLGGEGLLHLFLQLLRLPMYCNHFVTGMKAGNLLLIKIFKELEDFFLNS